MRKALDISGSAATTAPAVGARAGAARAGRTRGRLPDAVARRHLRRELGEHLAQLGYSSVYLTSGTAPAPEIARVSPVRGRIAYGETVLHGDLRRKRCHERLLFFSQRRTRRRSSILFFIGVDAADRRELEALLAKLDICSGIRGGHVHVVPIAAAKQHPRRGAQPATPEENTPRRTAPHARA